MDLAEVVKREVTGFENSGKSVICVVGQDERTRYGFCALMRDYFPNNFVYASDFGSMEMDAYLIDLSSQKVAA